MNKDTCFLGLRFKQKKKITNTTNIIILFRDPNLKYLGPHHPEKKRE
jgi:hypothetical protein